MYICKTICNNMDKLLAYFRQPYPVLFKPWKVIVVSSLLVFLLLALLQPFGIATITRYKYPILLGYMLVTTGCMSFQYYLLPFVARAYYDEQHWTLGKQIVNTMLTLLLIAIGNSCYTQVLSGRGVDLGAFLFFLLATLSIGIFPITFLTILQQNRLLARNLKEVTQLNNQLEGTPRSGPVEANNPVLLKGTGKEALEVDINELVLIEACANYVKISYTKQGKMQHKMLRATMKQIEEATAHDPSIVKCHRAFMVNVNAVVRVKGNSQGYRLEMDGLAEEIPVSRAFNKDLRAHIEALSTR